MELLANSATGGLALGYSLFSFGFSAITILILLFVIARHEAEFSGRVLLITPVVLCVVELAGNVFWTVVWQGFPGRLVTLGSVMAGAFVVGCILVYKIHIVGAVKSALVMALYTIAKAIFVVTMTYTYLYPLGAYTPSPLSSWYIAESWRGREVAGVQADFPGEFLPVSYNQQATEKQSNSRYSITNVVEADFGTFRVNVAQVKGIKNEVNPKVDMLSIVGFLLQQDGLDKGKVLRSASAIRAEYEKSGLEGHRLQAEYLYKGNEQEVDAVFVAEGFSGWVILVDGNKGEVQRVSTRIFSSFEISEESKRKAKADSDESKRADIETDADVAPKGGGEVPDKETPTSVYPIDRVITNHEGTKIVVKILGRTESRLIFEMNDGRTFKYLIRHLSPEDQLFVKELPVSEN